MGCPCDKPCNLHFQPKHILNTFQTSSDQRHGFPHGLHYPCSKPCNATIKQSHKFLNLNQQNRIPYYPFICIIDFGRPILSSSCLLIKFATPYIAGGPALFLWESPPYHHSFAGVPAIYISFSLAGVPAIYIFSLFLAGVPAIYISFSFAGVPATYQFQLRESPPILGLHSFKFHHFHPHLISKDEANNWSFTITHNFIFHHKFTLSSSPFYFITIIVHNWLPCMETIQPLQIILNSNGTHPHHNSTLQ